MQNNQEIPNGKTRAVVAANKFIASELDGFD
jgi:hypothetical protein